MAGSAAGSPELTVEERPVRITVGSLTIEGNLNLPAGSRAVVLFSQAVAAVGTVPAIAMWHGC